MKQETSHWVATARAQGLQLVGFGFMGILGTLCNLAITVALHELFGMSTRLAYLFGLAASILVNFFLCRNVLFKSAGKVYQQLFIFLVSSLFFRGLEYGAFLIIEATIRLHYVLAILLIRSSIFLMKFWYFKFVVFSRTEKSGRVEE